AAASGAFGAPDPVTVSFDLGGHGSPIAPQVVPWGEAPTEPPAPTEEGWTFLGWFADEARTVPFDFTAPRTEDATAYAAWTINTYGVAFDLGAHGAPVPSQTVEHGSTATEPAEPAADGWRFDGWYADPARTTPFDFAEPVTS